LCFSLVLGLGPLVTARAGTVRETINISDGANFEQISPPLAVPMILNATDSQPHWGTGLGVIDSGLALMRAQISTPGPRNPDGSVFAAGDYQLSELLFDTLTPHIQGGGTAVFTAHFTADGVITLPATDSHLDSVLGIAAVSLSIGGGGTGNNFAQVGFSTTPTLAGTALTIVPPGSIAVHFDTFFTFLARDLQSRDLVLELQVAGISGAALDFSNTARLTFDLPPGTSVSTDGGFVQTGSVPEPSTMVLVLLSLPIVGSWLWLRALNARPRSTCMPM